MLVSYRVRPIFGQGWPPNPSRTTGLVLQCRLHRTSDRQTNSEAISWLSGSLAILEFGPRTGPEPQIRDHSRKKLHE
jgi:hypothetical protein